VLSKNLSIEFTPLLFAMSTDTNTDKKKPNEAIEPDTSKGGLSDTSEEEEETEG
jgi:hypothetical protein